MFIETETESIMSPQNLLAIMGPHNGRTVKIYVACETETGRQEVIGVGHTLHEGGKLVRASEHLFEGDREHQLYMVKENSRAASKWLTGDE